MVETVASYGNVHMRHADSVFWVFVGGGWHIGGRGCHSKKCTVSIRLLREESHLVGRQKHQHTCRAGTWYQDKIHADPSCDILDGLDLSSCGLDCGPVSLRSADVSIEDVTELGCYPHAASGASTT